MMDLLLRDKYRRWVEVALPLYAIALIFFYFRPEYLPRALGAGTPEAVTPWAVWGIVGALSGMLALSGLIVAFFLLYSPLYLLARSTMLVGKKGWVDRRELRFYIACFILLCFLGGLAVWNPLVAASIFVLMAGSAHLIWRALV